MNPHFYSLEVCGMLPSSISSPAQINVIADWQRVHGLAVDGVIGPQTADAMHLDALARNVKLHFTNAEYLPKSWVPPRVCWPNIRRTLRACEVRRKDIFGGVACSIISGLRDPTKPRKPGQAKHSQHYPFEPDGTTPLCRAADMAPTARGTGTPPSQWRALTLAAMQEGRLEKGGFNTYTDQPGIGDFQHGDWRGHIVDGW